MGMNYLILEKLGAVFIRMSDHWDMYSLTQKVTNYLLKGHFHKILPYSLVFLQAGGTWQILAHVVSPGFERNLWESAPRFLCSVRMKILLIYYEFHGCQLDISHFFTSSDP